MAVELSKLGSVVAPTGFSKAKYRIEQGQDAEFAVISDSTGNDASSPRDWPWRFADDLAAAYPTHSVIVHPYNSTSSSWDAPVTISTGSTSAIIRIWNFAVSGASAQYGFGSLFDRALRGDAPDCMIFNHGHNHVTGQLLPNVRGEFLAAMETYRLYHPETPIVAIKQNPRSDSTVMNSSYEALNHIAALRDVSLVAVNDAFEAVNKDTSYYADTTHPNTAGQVLWESVVWEAWQDSPAVPFAPVPSSLEGTIPTLTNMLRNGGFNKWTTSPGVPENWTAGGTGTLTAVKDTTIVAREELGYSAKLTSVTGQSSMQQEVESNLVTRMRGKPVTFAVRRYVESTAGVNVGRINLQAGSPALGTQSITSRAYVTQQTGWVWWVISGFIVPDDCNYLRATLFHDATVGAPNAAPAYFDQAVLVPGYLPRRVA